MSLGKTPLSMHVKHCICVKYLGHPAKMVTPRGTVPQATVPLSQGAKGGREVPPRDQPSCMHSWYMTKSLGTFSIPIQPRLVP